MENLWTSHGIVIQGTDEVGGTWFQAFKGFRWIADCFLGEVRLLTCAVCKPKP